MDFSFISHNYLCCYGLYFLGFIISYFSCFSFLKSNNCSFVFLSEIHMITPFVCFMRGVIIIKELINRGNLLEIEFSFPRLIVVPLPKACPDLNKEIIINRSEGFWFLNNPISRPRML